MPDGLDPLPTIKVVGMSAGGKSTLVQGLRDHGYNARPISQEHSNIPELWRQFDVPDVLIHLDASLVCQRTRRPDVTWTPRYHAEESYRLRNARDHADLRIDTSHRTASDVLGIALVYLRHRGITHADEPLPPVTPTGSANRT